jgi:hypothetical protein
VHSTKFLTKYEKMYTSKFFSFIAGVVDSTDKQSFAITVSPRIFEKNRNDPNVILKGPGDTDLW